MTRQIICLADAQNFYVSVERAFNSALQHRPVVVLSNGDGNIIAASEEAKAIGLTRGLPFFKARSLIRKHHVAVYSSNYTQYQDTSDRIFKILSTYADIQNGLPQIESYSIDEAFFSASSLPQEHLLEYGRTMREHILRATGVPIRFAFGPTKQLAKVAAVLIKAHPEYDEVYSLCGVSDDELNAQLATVSVENLFGIGKRQAIRLLDEGITTAQALREAESSHIRRLLTVTGARIQYELRGVACIPLQIAPPLRKSIIYSRGFGRTVEALPEMREVVANYIARAAQKLRREHAMASEISVFIMTNPFDRHIPAYSRSLSTRLLYPTNFPPDLIRAANELLDQMYREGLRYKRAGVRLSNILPEDVIQQDLFGTYDPAQEALKARIMAVVDILNDHWNQEVIAFGAQGLRFWRDWEHHPLWLSRHSSTRWSELIEVT